MQVTLPWSHTTSVIVLIVMASLFVFGVVGIIRIIATTQPLLSQKGIEHDTEDSRS